MIGEVKVGSEEWHLRFFMLARHIAEWSKDPDQKVGAVLVDGLRRVRSMGYNGFPRGIADTRNLMSDKGEKNALTVHAELNAILNSPERPEGYSIYATRWPCHECAKAIVQSGVRTVVAPRPDFSHSRWGESWTRSYSMLAEAGLDLIRLEVH